MSKSYSILTSDEVATPVTAAEFFTALNERDDGGKLLYNWYDDGEYIPAERRYIRGDNNILIPKTNEKFVKVYRVHHNDISRQQMKGIRDTRAGFSTVSMDAENEDGEFVEREIEDENAEIEITSNAEHNDYVSHLRVALDVLKPLDREVIIALYGLDGQTPLSKTSCAAAFGKNWRTIDRIEKRVLARFHEMLSDFSDYGI